jgi:Leucine-rich repeat (LRR) protein
MRGLRSLFLVLPLLAASPAAAEHPWGPLPQREREALIDLYEETNGDEWANREGWLGQPGTECDWFGVECACLDETGETCPVVDAIDLGNNQLRGSLPRSLGNLRSLRSLDLPVNQLRGELPPELGRLRNLRRLELAGNELSGRIPPKLGSLVRLRWLNLSGNRLRGPIPDTLASLTRLQVLGLGQNQLTGELPRWLGSLVQLVILAVGENQLTGEIPEEIFDLEHLRELSLEENGLSGRIPTGIGNHELQEIRLQGNRLSGPVPETLARLDFLSFINVDWNALYPTSAEIEQFIIDRGGHVSWVFTQTLAPENLTATATGPTSVRLTWTPVDHIPGAFHAAGGYLVYVKPAPGGRFRFVRPVLGKEASSIELTGLTPATTFHFAVRTLSRPHEENDNSVRSELGPAVTVTTPAERVGGHFP